MDEEGNIENQDSLAHIMGRLGREKIKIIIEYLSYSGVRGAQGRGIQKTIIF